MKYRSLGSSGLEVSTVGLGTWAIGGGPWWGATDDEESVRSIGAAIDAGINLIDTAPVYGFGRSEEVVGRAIRGRRDRVVLATKCGLWWEDDTGAVFFEQLGRKVRRSLLPRTIRLEVDQSLRRLGTDRIDLMQTHWPAVAPEATPIAETMGCLMDLKREGKIRAIGASNVTPGQIDEYRAAGQIDGCQPRYSLLDRQIEAGLLPHCRKSHIATLVYSPLEQGLLTGRIGMDRQFAEDEYRNALPWFRPVNRKRVLEMLGGWADLEKKYSCNTGQLVIAWTLAQPGITSALCGARRAEHVWDNARAGDIAMEPLDIARIRRDAEALGEPAS